MAHRGAAAGAGRGRQAATSAVAACSGGPGSSSTGWTSRLSGPPGTGKTLLARADRRGGRRAVLLALSASEFIEMIVGVGAQRASATCSREAAQGRAGDHLHRRARRHRSARAARRRVCRRARRARADPEPDPDRDGRLRPAAKASIVLAATNRPDVLDPALLRAGRFDRTITLQRSGPGGRAGRS